MRWDRLFADLEAQAADVELDERDALVDELRDEEWRSTSWRALLGGHVVLEVQSLGRIEGVAVLVNERIIQLRAAATDHVVDVGAVIAILAAERRSETPSRVAAAWGWGLVLRALRDAGERVRLTRVGGAPVDGVIEVVGQDFARVREESGRAVMVPFGVIGVVSGRT